MGFDPNYIRNGLIIVITLIARIGLHERGHAVGMPRDGYYSLARGGCPLILSVVNTSVTRNIIGYVAGGARIPCAGPCDWLNPRAFPLIFP